MEKSKLFKVAEVRLSYESIHPPEECPQIRQSQDAYKVLLDLWDKDTIDYLEHFLILLLSRSNRAIGVYTLSTGGISGTVVDTKVLFAMVLKSGASGIILSHNHPSNNLKPSNADIGLTKKIKEGSKVLDINLIDHLIISRFGYYSFADEGIL